MATKPKQPKRSVSFMNHATVTDITDDSTTTANKDGNTTVVLTEEEDEDEEEDGKANGGIRNGIGAFSSPKPSAGTSATVGGVVRPGQNYVRRAPVNSDTESDEEKDDEPTRGSAAAAASSVSTPTPIAALNQTSNSTEEEEENSDTDNEDKKNGGGLGGLVKPMAQTRIAGPGQNYVRKAPVNSDSEDDDDKQHKPAARSTPAVNSPAPQQQPPNSGGSIHNRHLNTALGATGPAGSSAPHSRTSSYDPYAAAATGIVGGLGVGGLSSAMSSPSSGPVATSPYIYNTYTPPVATNLGMTVNNTSNSSLGNLSSSSSNAHLAGASSQIAAASLANSMAIYQQQQQEMMMIMQQQQIQIATMQQQQQAYQLLVYQQQQQHQQQLQAVHQHHSRAASANGSVHTVDTNTNTNSSKANTSDSDDDVPLGEKQNQLPQLPQLPSLPQFSSLMGMGSSSSISSSSLTTTPSSPTTAATTITPASPNTYSPRLSVQHSRQLSTSSVNNGGGAAYLHQPISSSPLNPATSNASISASLLGVQQHQVYSGGHSNSQTSSQPRLSDFIEEEQERLIREQHLQATAAALGGHAVTTPPTSFNGGTSLLTSSFPAGYRGSVASVMSLQQPSGIDRGSMTSLHSTGSNGSGGSGGSGGVGGGQHRPPGSRDSLVPQWGPTLIQQQQYLTQPHQYQQQQFLPYQQPTTLIHVEAKPPPPSAGLVGAISAMERDKKLAKAHGTNQLQFQHQQQQQQMMMSVEKERWLQEQRRAAWEAGQFPQQQQQQQFVQQGQFLQQGVMVSGPGLGQQVYYQQQPMMMQVPMQQQPGWTSADEEDDDRPLGATH
ncbi:hypothetical protein BGZ90_011603 [Linnemannia elongata]|nr:hypothetical protein BGZ90_011603 [Linnemannia elongata]